MGGWAWISLDAFVITAIEKNRCSTECLELRVDKDFKGHEVPSRAPSCFFWC